MANTKSLVIIGSGPGGYVAAVRAAQLGLKVTVIEKNGLGGVCLQHGCIPTKSILHSARVYNTVRNASSYGINCSEIGFDFYTIMKRKDDMVALNEKGIANLIEKHKIKIIRGEARLLSPNRIEITAQNGLTSEIDADYIIIATGSSSTIPSFIPADRERIFDSEGALLLQSLPESLIILGGGVLGCEFASFFNALGSEVTIVEQLQTILPGWDQDICRTVASSFRKRGIIVKTGARVVDVQSTNESGDVTVSLESGEKVSAKCCLVAFGRTPNIENIGLEIAGIKLWNGKFRGIQVNEFLQTNVPSIYAIGDVTGIRQLAHVASHQGITAVEHMCGKATPMIYDEIPDCYYGEPECASIGLTEQEALESKNEIAKSKIFYRSFGITHVLGETDGFVKVIAEKESGKVLGVHICGHDAPVMISEASVIVANGLTVDDIGEVIHPHPTLGEILMEGIQAVRGMNIHG
ncbi:MAG: dihydrolipoyl dehydrogenase [Candidatus Latescibacteria bacterium]|nr:dihydrolipoyl dehydrogenase [Candidatus Latescibacterota bacterium]